MFPPYEVCRAGFDRAIPICFNLVRSATNDPGSFPEPGEWSVIEAGNSAVTI